MQLWGPIKLLAQGLRAYEKYLDSAASLCVGSESFSFPMFPLWASSLSTAMLTCCYMKVHVASCPCKAAGILETHQTSRMLCSEPSSQQDISRCHVLITSQFERLDKLTQITCTACVVRLPDWPAAFKFALLCASQHYLHVRTLPGNAQAF